MNTPERAPDLKDGSMLHVVESNRWRTDVQCILDVDRETPERAALAHECRFENVPLSDGYLGGGRQIFQRARPQEFLVAAVNDQAFQFTAVGAFNRDPGYTVPADGSPTAALAWNPLGPGISVRVDCPDRAIRVLSMAEVIDALVDNTIPMRDLFLRVTWVTDETPHRLYAPCRYVNFAPDGPNGPAYVQPVSGYVLFPYMPTLHAAAYVSCELTATGNSTIEFACRRLWNTCRRLSGSTQDPQLGNIFSQLAQAFPVCSEHFDGVIAVEGTVDIYTYS